jgi:Holliday junction resolvase RusA-like endonuclease
VNDVSEIELDITPTPKPRMTQSDRWRSRPATDRYWAFKDNLRALWGDRPVPEVMHLVFVVPMPQSWSKKKRSQMTGKPHQTKPDVDNFLKSILDSLLDNDAHVWDIRATKVWGESGSILVREIPHNGQ